MRLSGRVLIQSRGTTRRFLKIAPASDGSMYFTFGWIGLGPSRIAEGMLTIPDGQTSASTDYSQNVVKIFSESPDSHVGYKATGITLTKVGTEYFRSSIPSPRVVAALTLLETIYPGRPERFSATTPRLKDIVVPRDFDWLSTPSSYTDIEELMGDDPLPRGRMAASSRRHQCPRGETLGEGSIRTACRRPPDTDLLRPR
jgi:hypothetical protein